MEAARGGAVFRRCLGTFEFCRSDEASRAGRTLHIELLERDSQAGGSGSDVRQRLSGVMVVTGSRAGFRRAKAARREPAVMQVV